VNDWLIKQAQQSFTFLGFRLTHEEEEEEDFCRRGFLGYCAM
jgi:hypothetical protein